MQTEGTTFRVVVEIASLETTHFVANSMPYLTDSEIYSAVADLFSCLFRPKSQFSWAFQGQGFSQPYEPRAQDILCGNRDAVSLIII